MSTIELSPLEIRAIELVLAVNDFDPIKVIKSAGLDQSTFFEFGVWEGVDFRSCDLRGVSFFGSDLRGAIFTSDQVKYIKSAEQHFLRSRVSKKTVINERELAPSKPRNPVSALLRSINNGSSSPGGPTHRESNVSDKEFVPLGLDSNSRLDQKTLRGPINFSGVGLHSGRSSNLTILPTEADQGIWFRRTDLVSGDSFIPARWDAVVDSRLCTLIANEDGASVSTIEHLMAALAGCGVNNAIVDIDGPEVPVFDGSSLAFVEAILEVGLRPQGTPLTVIEVLEEIEVRDGDAIARLTPSASFEVDFTIDFSDAAIGRQRRRLNLSGTAFIRELSDSRTFCRKQDVDLMQSKGLALGGTLENALVFDEGVILTPGGLRHRDEPVRHKMLDAVGDLSLAGAPILGRFVGVRGGHALTNRLLRVLFDHPKSYRLIRQPATSKVSGIYGWATVD